MKKHLSIFIVVAVWLAGCNYFPEANTTATVFEAEASVKQDEARITGSE